MKMLSYRGIMKATELLDDELVDRPGVVQRQFQGEGVRGDHKDVDSLLVLDDQGFDFH